MADTKPLPAIMRVDLLRFLSKLDRRGLRDCWNYRGGTSRGYGTFWLKSRKSVYAHRIAYFVFKHLDIQGKYVLRHSCDNPRCCNPAHLDAGLPVDNLADCKRKKRHRFGSTCSNAKLTEKKVRAMRQLRKKGAQMTDLALRFGVAPGTVWNICHRRKWKHVRP